MIKFIKISKFSKLDFSLVFINEDSFLAEGNNFVALFFSETLNTSLSNITLCNWDTTQLYNLKWVQFTISLCILKRTSNDNYFMAP